MRAGDVAFGHGAVLVDRGASNAPLSSVEGIFFRYACEGKFRTPERKGAE